MGKLSWRVRFTLRDLLSLVVISAMLLGWWADHRRLWSYIDVLRDPIYEDMRRAREGDSAADKRVRRMIDRLKSEK